MPHSLFLPLMTWLLVSLPATATGQAPAVTPTSQLDTQEGREPSPYCVPEAWQGGRDVTQGIIGNSGFATVTQVRREKDEINVPLTLSVFRDNRQSKSYNFQLNTPPSGTGNRTTHAISGSDQLLYQKDTL